jgi:hypothetical protein
MLDIDVPGGGVPRIHREGTGHGDYLWSARAVSRMYTIFKFEAQSSQIVGLIVPLWIHK